MRVTLMAMCLAGAVQADEAPMRAQEQLRLDGFQASAGKALLQALSAGTLGVLTNFRRLLLGRHCPHWPRRLRVNGTAARLNWAGSRH